MSKSPPRTNRRNQLAHQRSRHVVAHVVGDARGKALVVLLPTAVVLTRTSAAQGSFLGSGREWELPQDSRSRTWRTAWTVLRLTRKTQRCLGVLTARMTPTAQAGRKSWYVSASRGMRRKNAPTQRLVANPRRTLMPTKRRNTTTTKVDNWPGFGLGHSGAVRGQPVAFPTHAPGCPRCSRACHEVSDLLHVGHRSVRGNTSVNLTPRRCLTCRLCGRVLLRPIST